MLDLHSHLTTIFLQADDIVERTMKSRKGKAVQSNDVTEISVGDANVTKAAVCGGNVANKATTTGS